MTGDWPLGFVLLDLTLLVLLGPLVTGVIQKVKARLQCRQGAGVLQPYRDLTKLFRKGTVQADTASGFFRSIPVLVLAATAAAGALVPVVRVGPSAFPLGDAVMLLGLLALARFLTAVGALDAVVTRFPDAVRIKEGGHQLVALDYAEWKRRILRLQSETA